MLYKIKLEILEYNRWECLKASKDLASILPLNHPKRTEIEKQLNELQIQIYKLRKNEK